MTSFTIHRSALLPALERTGRIIERRNTIPILANLRLVAEGERLTLSGTDLDMEMIATAELAAAGSGDLTLPATLLSDFVRKLPETAELTFAETEGHRVRVSAGRTRALLPWLPSADYPGMSSDGLTTAMEIRPADLARILTTVQFAISTEETRFYLCGVYFHHVDEEGEKRLRAVATDGHRLARADMAAPDGTQGMPAVILPRKTVAEMLRLLKVKDETPVRLELSNTRVRLTMPDGTTLTSKLIDGSYPDYQRVIPSGNPNRFTMKAAPLAAAIDRVATISGERGRAVKFSFGTAELGLECSNPDSGQIADALTVEACEGEARETGFNGTYCRDALAALAGDEVTFSLADAGAPTVLTGANPLDLFVLMPMRI